MAALATAKAGATRVGWVGTGVMGAAMCGQLIQGGFSATVYNRTASKAQGLVDAVRAAPARPIPPSPGPLARPGPGVIWLPGALGSRPPAGFRPRD